MKPKLLLISSLVFATAMFLTNPAAQAQIVYIANLDGPSESPANASPGTGFAEVTIDLATHTLVIDVTFSGLTGTTTASHIHAPTTVPFTGTAGVATQTPSFTDFPLGVTSGTYHHSFDTSLLSTYNAPFVTANGGTAAGAESALAASLAAGTAYLNIHSTAFPGGEIRGFLAPQAIPEPTTVGLVCIGGLGLLFARRRARFGRKI
jgi:hypothetical protein